MRLTVHRHSTIGWNTRPRTGCYYACEHYYEGGKYTLINRRNGGTYSTNSRAVAVITAWRNPALWKMED